MTRERNPWKIALLSITGGVLMLGVGAAVANLAEDESSESREESSRAAPAVSTRAPTEVVEHCNQLAAQARRDPNRILRDGVIGGAVDAGVGAAGGAIADGGDGAGRGAGIGALVGAAAGTLVGLNEENRKSELAMAAYQQCMARRGYRGEARG
jgi:uncharacterized protein YcfJ